MMVKTQYYTVLEPIISELTEKKSRFISYLFPVHSEQEVLTCIQKIKMKHHDATHHVYAYQVHEAEQLLQGFTDDGEPSGTAGRPVLDLIQHYDLTDLVIIVTRYFGGTLLGTGGLTRTYGKAAKMAIEKSQIIQCVPAYKYNITFHYSSLGKVENYLLSQDVLIEEVNYRENINMTFLVATTNNDRVIQGLNNIFNGSPQLLLLNDHSYLQQKISK